LDEPFLDGLKPYRHQHLTRVAVERAIGAGQSLCIVNASVTGSGKTLANFARAILHDTHTLAVYPTNELIADQWRAVQRFLPVDEVVHIDSEELDSWQEQMQTRSHVEVLEKIVGDWMPLVVLTNPDILYLLMFNLYGYEHKFMAYRDRVFRMLLSNYPIVVFDEFHLYDSKQVANVAFIVGAMLRLAPKHPHVFIFSSATPRPVAEIVSRLGLSAIDVTAPPEPEGRVVTEPVDLTLVPAELARWGGKDAIESLMPEIMDFADKEHPGARGVFIVDSVYDARLIRNGLARLCGEDAVGELHGYTAREGRAGALERRMTVGTSTIDVGVDLVGAKAKEFLVFEARTPEQFVQRLGRLGRRGREPDDISAPNRAWAFIPHYAYNAIRDHIELSGIPVPRQQFIAAVVDAYRPYERFSKYAMHFAPLEAAAAADRILRQELSDRHTSTSQCLDQLLVDLYRPRAEDVTKVARGLRGDQRRLWRTFGGPVRGSRSAEEIYLPEIEAFRGSDYFDCALYDCIDAGRGLFPFRFYNLLFVLRRTNFREHSVAEFTDMVRRHNGSQAERFLRRVEQRRVVAHLTVESVVEGPATRFWFEIDDAALDAGCDTLLKLKGFRIASEPTTHLRLTNRTLEGRSLIAWVSQLDPWSLAARFCLPPLFHLYPLRPIGPMGRPSSGTDWSVAFGLSAFLLESTGRKLPATKPIII
jgi:CRISPR-associated endonuclease/helicase Cas3